MHRIPRAFLVTAMLPAFWLAAGDSPRAAAQSHGAAPARTLQAIRADVRPTVDGRLDDPAWAAAQVATDFTQTRPNEGRPATQRTEVRILYDDDALYVAARMFDTAPDSIVAQLARRDTDVHSDWFYVAVDSYFDRRTAFAFGLNPVGVKVDLLLFNDTELDSSWDAVWEGAAARDEHGWSAEFRIPYSQLRFSRPAAGGEHVWGVNFMRSIARNGEESFWAQVPADDAQGVSVFGTLHGLRDLRTPRRLEVMPYAVLSATRAPGVAGDPFHRDIDPFAGMGVDLKAGITSDLTLTATMNPDFGQVEADPSFVNLTPTEIFFSERRPFFVEGVDIFRFGLGIGDGDLGNESLFYSRRIGRPPQGGVDGEYTTRPDHTTILGAAKVSGKTADGWSIGLLDALTGRAVGRYRDDGVDGEVPVEPLTNYAVVRVMRDFDEGRTTLGAIATATHRSLPPTGELDWLRRSAYTGGFDARHRFGGDVYQLRASLVGSRIAGPAQAIDRVQRSPVHNFHRPDADHLDYDPERTSLEGFAAKTELFKLQGNWRFALVGVATSPGFEANDLGFQTNADLAVGGWWVGYQQYEQGRHLRSWYAGHNLWTGATFAGERVSLGGNVNAGFQHRTFWGGNFGINTNARELSTTLLRGGPAFLRPANQSMWASAYTDNRRPVRWSASLSASRQAGTGGRSLGLGTGLTVRPSHNADFFMGPSLSVNRNPIQYVATRDAAGQAHWILGTVEQTTVAMTTRLNYTVSPTLSIQLYAQPFVSAGEYSRFRLVTDPRAGRFEEQTHLLTDGQISSAPVDGVVRHWVDVGGDGTPDFQFDDPGFNFRQLRSNLVLRWEYRPGSALFLVWSQGRTDFERDGRFHFGDDVGAMWRAEGTNVLLIKASYWFGL
jgi:hypothetical protein